MHEVFIDLIPYLGWPAAFVVVGCIADAVCASSYKGLLVKKIRAGDRNEGISRSARLFIKGIVSSVPGLDPANFRFIKRSACITVICCVVIVTSQSFIYKLDPYFILSTTDYSSYINIAILVTTTIVADIISNACAVTILKQSLRARNSFGFLVNACAGASLSITVFSLIFPLGVIVALYLSALATPAFTFQMRPAVAALTPALGVLKQGPSTLDTNYSVDILNIVPIKIEAPTLDNTSAVVILRSKKERRVAAETALDFLDINSNETKIFGDEAIASADIHITSPSLRWIEALYVGAFIATENIRTQFIAMVKLETVSIRASAVYALARDQYKAGRSLVSVKCLNFEIRKFTTSPANFDQLIKDAKVACNGDFISAFSLLNGGSGEDELRMLRTRDTLLPLCTFFCASLFVSILYYLGIYTVHFGLYINRGVASLFKSDVLRIEELPFLFLGILCFSATKISLFVGSVLIYLCKVIS